MQVFTSPQSSKYARMAGLLYLGIAAAGVFSIAYVPSEIIVAGDVGATVANMVAKSGLFHLGTGADALVMSFEITLTAMLFFMFRGVNRTLALAGTTARLMMVAVMAAMLFFHAGADYIATNEMALANFSAAQRDELAGLFLHINQTGVLIWQLFFFLHLLILGGLVIKSDRFPSLFGYGLFIGAWGYLLDSIYAYAFPEMDWLGMVRIGFLAVVTLSEIGFALWLAVRAPAAPSAITSEKE